MSDDLLIKKEVYTDRLMDMSARLCECRKGGPYFGEIEAMREKIALAHNKSRFYSDRAHFEEWEALLSDAAALLEKGE